MSNGEPSPNRWKLVLIGFAMIAGFFLIAEHRAHFFQYWPFLLLAACPLLHLFHGHGGHGAHGRSEPPGRSAEEQQAKRASGSALGGKDWSSEQHHHH
jgi:hypothetical protein